MRTLCNDRGWVGVRVVSAIAVIVLGIILVVAPAIRAAGPGQWQTLPYTMPINPIHAALLHTGEVLIVAGSGNDPTVTNFEAAIYDPISGTFDRRGLSWDMFCNGMVVLPDGRVLVNSGTLAYDPFHGELRSAVYDPSARLFADIQNMKHGRWYPTVTVLGDGRVMTFSGLNETGGTNTAVEIYTPGSGWSPEYAAGWTPPLYPRMHLVPDGRVFYSGSGRGSRFFSPSTNTWTNVVATTIYSGTRTYGSSVLLPLTPANNYRPKVMIMGGGNPATATTEIIDLGAATPAWQAGPPMSQPRIEMNATILPDGKVLIVGGSKNDEDASTASLNADLYDPATNTVSLAGAGANVFPRLYHSNSLLLPDATVLLFGGNPVRGTYEPHIEVYSPGYLFNTSGTPAQRPAIAGVSASDVTYGGAFQIQTTDAGSIGSVVLVRPGAPTHAFDMEQRLVGLPFTIGSGVLNVTGPSNGNIAPPGYYMLFIVNTAGVPSVARFVHLSSASANQRPTATIVSPGADVTINAGDAVSFSGAGNDPDGTIASFAWTFPGGTPASSSSAFAGNVAYSTGGTYTASLTVTDNGGLTSTPAQRTVTVNDFSLSATPSSRTVIAGGEAAYTATVTALNAFTGTVSFAVGGLPAGTTASFNPASVVNAGSTTLTVSTSTTTPAGSYPLTITATSGAIRHTATVTLVVASDFTLTVSPSTVSFPKGGSGSSTVTVAGASGTTNFSVTGLPKFVTAKFNPSSIVNSGSSVLSLSSNRNVAAGTYSLTVNATNGSVVHSATVTLNVQ